jgi:hypothetical protein
MTNSILRLATATTVAVVLAAGLSGCGKLGRLERPGPMTRHASGADAGPNPGQAVRTVDPRDRNSDPAPSRTAPIDSTNDPMASGPQGALENPYARPK